MASSRHNILLRHFTGGISDTHYLMNRGGKEIWIRKPNRSLQVKTQKQKLSQSNFKRSQQYASEVNKDPVRKSFYTPFRKDGKTEYNLALSDFSIAPVIHSYDLHAYRGKEGDIIEVDASDNIKVIAAWCVIYTFDGSIIEEGAAQLNPFTGLNWEYTVKNTHQLQPDNIILFSVFDFAGNETKKVLRQ